MIETIQALVEDLDAGVIEVLARGAARPLLALLWLSRGRALSPRRPALTRRTWHPIFATEERVPGVFTLVGAFGDEYGIVEIRRAGPRVRWRASYRGEVLGYATTLRLAVERVHAAYLAAHGPGGSPAARWGETG